MTAQGQESQTILVAGGGIAGMSAAVEAAETGYDVVLLEKEASLGGRVAQLNRYFPKLCHPACGLEINYQRLRSNPRIRVITMASVAEVSGTPGAYRVKVQTQPRYVNGRCTACGDCAKASGRRVKNPFNYGMDTVPAAYLPHPMAYPMRYVVAPEVIGTPEAQAIAAACKYGAIDLDETAQTFDLPVATIIWATGWKPYDAGKLESYGYGRVPNVITNVEMERLAADGGPTGGKILRPSDGKEAKRVALIQCAGSRDLNHLPYCSRICCLASMKHAAYVRAQYADSEVDVYYIDLRAHDKLESFYLKVKADPQVRFVKSKVGLDLRGRRRQPGAARRRHADARTLRPALRSCGLGHRHGAQCCDAAGFNESGHGRLRLPCSTRWRRRHVRRRRGLGPARCFHVRAVRHRGRVESHPDRARGAGPMTAQPKKLGVYLCGGCGIAEAAPLANLEKVAVKEFKAPFCKTHDYLCGEEGLSLIRGDVEAGTVNQAVIAACSPRVNQDKFRFDGVQVIRANLREQVAWTQPPGVDDTEMLAADNIRMAITEARKSNAPVPYTEGPFNERILVVGGGLAGLTAAIEAARTGHEVLLVEESGQLGGNALAYSKVVPERPPYREPQPNPIHGLIAEAQKQKRIEVRLNARPVKTSGMPGRFKVEVKQNGAVAEEVVGAIVIATGWHPYDASKLGHLGYGASPDVVTSLELEEMLAKGAVRRKSNGAAANVVAFVLCAGSRDPEHLPYCSSTCCTGSIRQALQIVEADPKAMVYIIFDELRTPGVAEEFYRAAQKPASSS